MAPIRVLTAADPSLLRAGLRALISEMDGIQLAAEAGDGLEALNMIRTLHPDVAVLAAAMPKLNGLEAAERARKDAPGVQTILLSMQPGADDALGALRVGVSGYLQRNVTASELEIAIRAVARGETYLTPAVSKMIVAECLAPSGSEPRNGDPLTPRQREILRLIATGKSTKGIATGLSISVKTVEAHRAQLMNRLDIHDLAGLVRYAIRKGLITQD